MAKTCKTCAHWTKPNTETNYMVDSICTPLDPDTFRRMERGFEVRMCTMPTQTFCETPIERDSFGLTDGSEYMACLVTAEAFGCVRHTRLEVPA